ncbi:MAG: hypothetical protein ACTSQ0_09695 [Candidatus Heimdallarchaeota archaeon]
MIKQQQDFIETQIALFKEKRGDYIEYAELIKKVLSKLLKQYSLHGIIQARAKTIASFSDKIFRKIDKYSNPIEDMTDLCGSRIILDSIDDVKKTCEVIEQNFIISLEHSEDKLERLSVSEFGYLSNHYIIRLKKGSSLLDGLTFPERFYDVSIEIQIRTLLQHGWAQIQHDTQYKGDFTIPKHLQRKSYRVAAVLESTDHDFQEMMDDMTDFQENYGAYLSGEQLEKELEKMAIVFKADQTDISTVIRYAYLLRYVEKWDKMIEILFAFVDSNNSIILREIGLALCKKNKVESEDYQKGISYLEKALVINPEDADTYCVLGGRWKEIDEEKALNYYRKASEIEPSNPNATTNYLALEIKKQKSLGFISFTYSIIRKVIEKCQKQINHKINLPWAYFDIGLLHMLIGESEVAYNNYLAAIKYSSESWMIATTLKTLSLFDVVREKLPDLSFIEDLLTIGAAYKFGNQKLKDEFLKSNTEVLSMELPIIILAGSSTISSNESINLFKEKLLKSFPKYTGTLISGGTLGGVCGIVGDLQEKYAKNIKSIGFVPENIPKEVQIDSRYSQIVKTTGNNFSIRQVIAYWKNILQNKIKPEDVKVLGFAGGKISSFEYRFAILLCAQVGLVAESGGSADYLLQNVEWNISLQTDKKNSMLSEIIAVPNAEKGIKKFIEE